MNIPISLLSSLRRLVPIMLMPTLVACIASSDSDELQDELRVTTTSEAYRAAAMGLMEPCNNPAEFGRCGCYLDGLQTSCDLVSRCLENGFCQVARAEMEPADATSQSPIFSTAAAGLMQVCPLPAEFGRCGCTLDGVQTSCDIVHRCLENGFCRVAIE
jgi:hypothetical protein